MGLDYSLSKQIHPEYMRLILRGKKTIEGRNQNPEYNLPTPYYIKFYDSEVCAIVKVTRVDQHPDLRSYISACLVGALPNHENIEQGMIEYLGIVHPKTGNRVFAENSPITALTFVLTDEHREKADQINVGRWLLQQKIDEMKQEKQELEKLMREEDEKTSCRRCAVCKCIFRKSEWNTGPWYDLCGEHAY